MQENHCNYVHVFMRDIFTYMYMGLLLFSVTLTSNKEWYTVDLLQHISDQSSCSRDQLHRIPSPFSDSSPAYRLDGKSSSRPVTQYSCHFHVTKSEKQVSADNSIIFRPPVRVPCRASLLVDVFRRVSSTF